MRGGKGASIIIFHEEKSTLYMVTHEKLHVAGQKGEKGKKEGTAGVGRTFLILAWHGSGSSNRLL
jgi:GTPase involved in cell partitioning and DNA repair